MPKKAILVLEDGSLFKGASAGSDGEVFGEVVFNTAMTGYQEILTDPSYKGQIVCMTYPHIGNYGVNEQDMESDRPWAEGFIVREMSDITSNFRASESLKAYLKKNNIVAIEGIDTRALTLKLRSQGSLKGGISSVNADPNQLLKKVEESPSIVGADLVKDVTCAKPYEWQSIDSDRRQVTGDKSAKKYRVVVMDFGVKHNILREVARLGCSVAVVPANFAAEDILSMKPDGLVLSNGPADPAAVTYAIKTIKSLIGKLPILGICLGHQLIGLAMGGKTFKLKFGHHGANQPVKDLTTGKIEITSQNHGFAVDIDSIPDKKMELTHLNLNDNTVEGMRHAELPIFSLQYHPEASPGPHDSRYLFGRFMDLMGKSHAEGS
jgi:carbamoyl-phosphate synthase small subunit